MFTDLGTLGGVYSQALAINNAGQIVGDGYTATSVTHAALWTASGATDLGTLGGQTSRAVAINSVGDIAGAADLASGQTHATLWRASLAIDLSATNAGNSQALGLNDQGVVVGSTTTSAAYNAPSHAMVWEGGGATDLGPRSNGDQSFANAVNNAGQVAGSSNAVPGAVGQATLWIGGVPTDVTGGAQYTSAVRAINGSGTMVGLAQGFAGAGTDYAVRWDSGVPVALPPLVAGKPAYANAINAAGLAVGYTDTSFGYRATLWQGDRAVDLNQLLDPSTSHDWTLSIAWGINDGGSVVGEAFNPSNQQIHAFLLSPVPEPATWTLMLAGVLGIGLRAAIRRQPGTDAAIAES